MRPHSERGSSQVRLVKMRSRGNRGDWDVRATEGGRQTPSPVSTASVARPPSRAADTGDHHERRWTPPSVAPENSAEPGDVCEGVEFPPHLREARSRPFGARPARPLPGPVRPHARRRPHGTPSRFSDGPGSLLSQARCTCCSCRSNRSMSRAPHPLTWPLPPSCRLPAQRSSVSEYNRFRSWL